MALNIVCEFSFNVACYFLYVTTFVCKLEWYRDDMLAISITYMWRDVLLTALFVTYCNDLAPTTVSVGCIQHLIASDGQIDVRPGAKPASQFMTKIAETKIAHIGRGLWVLSYENA